MALLALLVAGCRSNKPTAVPTPSKETPAYTVLTFTGEVDGLSISGQVRMKEGEIIWGSVSKFVEVGRALATPDSVWVKAPLLGRRFTGSYRDVAQQTGIRTTFAELEALLQSDDAEARLAALAEQLGHSAILRITRREKVETLSFPFSK